MKKEYSVINHYLSSEDFHVEVESRIKRLSLGSRPIMLLAMDFDNFNCVNDLFGYSVGDLTLRNAATHFSKHLHEGEIFSRTHSDHFVFCLDFCTEYEAGERFAQLSALDEAMAGVFPPHYNLVSSGGMVTVANDNIALPAHLDNANYARKKAKGGVCAGFRFYDDKMGEELHWQKVVTRAMESSLVAEEFEMYLQPKVLTKSSQIMGAEALIRWNSPKYGMVYPDQFIPIMEQNGFICQLDFFMLGQACKFIKESAEQGRPLIPISVNFSKAHLATENLVQKIVVAVSDAGIPASLIEIEFTESLSADGMELMIQVVTDLKLAGFKVSLDDFGSAYSSLSYLKDLPFDIVKIDKGFLNSSKNTEKGKFIIAKVMELVKSLRMLSVMEGVEDIEQVEFLRKLSCDIGQGYFYAKPMPASDFVTFLNNGTVVSDVTRFLSDETNTVKSSDASEDYFSLPQEFQMDNWELYTIGKSINMGLIKCPLDEACTVRYINDCAIEYFGYTREELRNLFNNSIIKIIHPDDVDMIRKNTAALIKSGNSLKFRVRVICKDNRVITLEGTANSVIDNKGKLLGIYAFQDITEGIMHEAEMESKIAELEAALKHM